MLAISTNMTSAPGVYVGELFWCSIAFTAWQYMQCIYAISCWL